MIRRFVLPLLILALFVLAAYKIGFKNMFIPSAVRTVKQESNLDSLARKAEKAEEQALEDPAKSNRAGEVWENLGDSHLKQKNWTPAVNSFKKAIEYGNSGAPVHYGLAVGYANRGGETDSDEDINKALRHYRRALEINPDMKNAAYGFAILLYYEKNRKEQAMEITGKIIEQDPTFYRARFALGRMRYESGNLPGALAVYENLYEDLKKKPDSPRLREYKEKASGNITRIMSELNRR